MNEGKSSPKVGQSLGAEQLHRHGGQAIDVDALGWVLSDGQVHLPWRRIVMLRFDTGKLREEVRRGGAVPG